MKATIKRLAIASRALRMRLGRDLNIKPQPSQY